MKNLSFFGGCRRMHFAILLGILLHCTTLFSMRHAEIVTSEGSKVEKGVLATNALIKGALRADYTNREVESVESKVEREVLATDALIISSLREVFNATTRASANWRSNAQINASLCEFEALRADYTNEDFGRDPSSCLLRMTNEERMTEVIVQQQISGVVTDANGPLPGVTITVKDGTAATISDQYGNYTITASPTDVLIYTFIGYKTQEVPVQGRIVINATMQEDATALQEVTVNAGYYTVKDRERTGSIASIKAEDIEKQPVSNVLATMQGRMAGVDVTQDNGMPGGGFQIRIRGINSLRADGNEPLYIVDGVPFSSESIGAQNTSGVYITMTSPLNSINPGDIESVEILKDADATAIYGSRGANGVVLITTKKGKAGRTRFTAQASTGTAKVAQFAKMLSTEEFIRMREQAFENDGFDPPFFAYDVNGTWDRTRYTDWQKELIGGTAEIREMQASISGGNSNTSYLLSGSHRAETTVVPGDFKYDKGAIHFSANHVSPDDRFRLSFSAGYTAQKNNQPGSDLTSVALSLAPNAPALYDEEGNLNWEDGTFSNPLAPLQSEFLARINNLTANGVLSYNLFPGLQLKGNFGYNEIVNDEQRTLPSTIFSPSLNIPSSSSSLNVSHYALRSWIAEPQLSFKTEFGKTSLDALLGSTIQNQRTNRLAIRGIGFASNSQINDLASAANRTILQSNETIYKYQAFFARVNYNYDGRYIVNLTGRRDGSSRFGPGRQFANFGAVGAAWLFSNESLLKGSPVLSFGKLRASYGITGNDQIGDYQFLDTYSSTGINYDGTIGVAPSRLYNPAFGWESSTKFEVALETGFFQDRIFLTAAYFKNRSSDQLVGIPMPGTTGFSSLSANLNATVENRGMEFSLRTLNLKGNDFSWITNFNISLNRNELLSFPGLEGSTYANTFVVGESINITKLYHYTGINPETGIYEFEDVDGDGVLTSRGDRNQVVDLTPDYYGGIQNHFSYKGFELDFLFQFVKQQRFEFNLGAPGYGQNQLAGNGTGWEQPGDTAQNQILTGGFNSDALTAFDRFSVSDGAVTDGSYIKLRNAYLGYTLPLADKNLNCRIFVQGQNLLTFTSYKGADPEFKYPGQMPPLRVISMGAKLSF